MENKNLVQYYKRKRNNNEALQLNVIKTSLLEVLQKFGPPFAQLLETTLV